ncbi:MAG TPA: DnaB-like helicase N-terminal domain-containing protein, partial [Candidatus Acidoferrales bacterium]
MHADRPLPHNVDAERGMLGAILLDNSALNAAIELLKPEDFFLESHRRVFRCMVAMDEGGQPIDLLTLASELERRGDLEAVGGSPYVSQLIDGVPRLTNVEHYAQLVRQASLLRSYAHAGEAIRLAALQQGAEPEKILGSLRELLDRGVVATKRRLRAVSAEELLQMNVPPREMILNPILPTQGLVMLYSKRGVGKTFIALAMAHAVATGGRFLQWSAPKARSVLYVDGELPATTLRERLAAVIAGAEPTRIGGLKPLRLITPDLQDYPLPDLATREG